MFTWCNKIYWALVDIIKSNCAIKYVKWERQNMGIILTWKMPPRLSRTSIFTSFSHRPPGPWCDATHSSGPNFCPPPFAAAAFEEAVLTSRWQWQDPSVWILVAGSPQLCNPFPPCPVTSSKQVVLSLFIVVEQQQQDSSSSQLSLPALPPQLFAYGWGTVRRGKSPLFLSSSHLLWMSEKSIHVKWLGGSGPEEAAGRKEWKAPTPDHCLLQFTIQAAASAGLGGWLSLSIEFWVNGSFSFSL